jgi:Fe-S cluster assembly protein SufD
VKTKVPVEGDQSWTIAALAAANSQSTKLPASMQKLVKEAAAIWSKVLFPTPRLEAWKYTSVERIAKGGFAIADGGSASVDASLVGRYVVSATDPLLVVFVDGVFSESLSSAKAPTGITISRLLQNDSASVGALRMHESEPFVALATALMTDGIEIEVAKGAAGTTPIQIVNLTTAASSGKIITPRVSIIAKENSQVTVIDSHVTSGAQEYLSLPVVEIKAEAYALVDLYRFQDEAQSAYHVSGTSIEQAQSSSVNTHFFSFGSALSRNNVKVALRGTGCTTLLNGLSVLSGGQHVDNATEIHHIEPHCESREHFKGIYSDTSRGIFTGTITVDKIAQKTNAFQSNQALLLSPSASIETRPQLQIWADDVKCTHGATVGQLDADALFYLRSRGLSQEDARNFLIHAFASEVLTTIRIPELREYVEQVLTAKLGHGEK